MKWKYCFVTQGYCQAAWVNDRAIWSLCHLRMSEWSIVFLSRWLFSVLGNRLIFQSASNNHKMQPPRPVRNELRACQEHGKQETSPGGLKRFIKSSTELRMLTGRCVPVQKHLVLQNPWKLKTLISPCSHKYSPNFS